MTDESQKACLVISALEIRGNCYQENASGCSDNGGDKSRKNTRESSEFKLFMSFSRYKSWWLKLNQIFLKLIMKKYSSKDLMMKKYFSEAWEIENWD